MLAGLLPVLPIVFLLAATNTFNEEFQFRNVPLATLPALLGKAQALLLTAVYSGLEHFYGIRRPSRGCCWRRSWAACWARACSKPEDRAGHG